MLYVTHYTFSHTANTWVIIHSVKLCLIGSTDGQSANSLTWERLEKLSNVVIRFVNEAFSKI